MSVIGTKKTLNLHKYSIKVNDFLSNWKIIIPVIFTFAGIISGCIGGKGEGRLYKVVADYFTNVILARDTLSIASE